MLRNAGDYVKSWGAALIRGAASNPEFTVGTISIKQLLAASFAIIQLIVQHILHTKNCLITTTYRQIRLKIISHKNY